jgi:pantetheine-phosphate adenylyltransferase
MTKAVFPGSFDPFTRGHEAIAHKALTIVDELIIAVGINSNKSSLFELNKRINHIESLFSSLPVKVISFEGLTVSLCQDTNSKFIIRGLRDGKDFEYEKSIAHMNFKMSKIDTLFLLTTEELSSINSSIVREIYKNKADISPFVTNVHLLV